MNKYLRRIRQRQEHIGYFVIAVFLFALAIALGKPSGWLAVLGLFAIFLVFLELIYRAAISLGVRNRTTWWAQQHKPGYWRSWVLLIYAGIALGTVLIKSPLTRYSLVALLAGGVLGAGIIRWLRSRD